MNKTKRVIVASAWTLLAVCLGLTACLELTVFAQQRAPTDKGTVAIASAAKKFLASLDEAQRGKVVFDFNDKAQRERWSNLPTGIFQRAGLRLGDLAQPQRDAAMAVLAAALSPAGYEKTVQIVQADEVLREGSGGGRGGRGGAGGGVAFGRDNYFISFLGQPSDSEPWMIQFGGHHLGLNITLVGEQGTLAPSHTGAQPALYEFESKTVRPLGREVDKSFALINALDEAQRQQAILGVQMRDLVLGPGREGQTIQPEGIKGSSLSEKQREMLLDLANEWTGIMHEAVATAKLNEMKKNLGETWFAWAGPTEKGSAAYFRIQGPTVHIEYAPQRMGGEANQHIHTIYRDPTNEYGRAGQKMKLRLAASVLVLVWVAKPAFGHRVDEYLQATMFNVASDHIEISLRLTPGIEVFGKVLTAIDANGDEAISAAEQQAYAEDVGRRLSLSIDDRELSLRLLSVTFPELQKMRQGLGEIVLNFDAQTPPGDSNRRLVFENHHLPAISVYLANCLVPSDPNIRVIAQKRNLRQSIYQVDFSQGDFSANGLPNTPAPSLKGWLNSTGSESLFQAFFYQGVHHILTGYDHLLFVGALVLAVSSLWDLIKVVSVFTLAHTITLALAAMNLVHAPEWLVEPLIAGSIVFIAIQNVFGPCQARGWSRLAAAFFFGLFHGLGFAGGLLQAMREMPNGTMFLAIFAFSLEVEAGHQMVVLPLFGLLKIVRQTQPTVVAQTQLSMALQRIGSAGISVAGIFYLCRALTDRFQP